MGKAKVDSDYSGRPLGRPTPEEVAASPPPIMEDYLTEWLRDGTLAYRAPGGKLYHEMRAENGEPVFGRPVPEELLP